jgi:hypothetical protein
MNARISVVISDNQGRRSSFPLDPGGAITLRRSPEYIVELPSARVKVTLDASPKVVSLFEPYELTDLPEYQRQGVWQTRWYQITDRGNGPEIRAGFGEADISEVLAAYRAELDAAGFVSPALIPVPRPPRIETEEDFERVRKGKDPAQLEYDAIASLRREQHRCLSRVLARFISAGVADLQDSPQSKFVETVGIFRGADTPWLTIDNQAADSGVTLGQPLSPEVRRFVRRVAAAILGIEEESVRIATAPAAAPSGLFALRPEFTRDRNRLPGIVQSGLMQAMNTSAYFRTFSFGAFSSQTASVPSVNGGQNPSPEVRFTALSGWRVHSVTEDVVSFRRVSALIGKDMRWRVVLTGRLVDQFSTEPLCEVSIDVEMQTKKGHLGVASYRTWDDMFPLIVAPLGGGESHNIRQDLADIQMNVVTKLSKNFAP